MTFEEARACVVRVARERAPERAPERVGLLESAGRVLAETIRADRDYPAVDRSVRDGFAVRAGDTPGALRVVGEVRAGEAFAGRVGPGEAVEIMTGAGVPLGADAVIMVEHVPVADGFAEIGRGLAVGENVNPRGAEAAAGQALLEPGMTLDYSGIALLAMVGRSTVEVYTKPRVAILATGDEVVEIEASPAEYQVRNSNSYSLAAQVAAAGGIPVILPVARDEYESTRASIEQGLRADLLLLAGGVSAGKYDIVERVLADLGARFHFDRVKIQPGQPVVFGEVGGRMFFGLPGNPGSTMVTFEVLARAALEMLIGKNELPLAFSSTRLAGAFRQKPGLTRFLPAVLSADGAEVTAVAWRGSGDVPALARANAYLVTDPDRETWAAGDMIRVLAK